MSKHLTGPLSFRDSLSEPGIAQFGIEPAARNKWLWLSQTYGSVLDLAGIPSWAKCKSGPLKGNHKGGFRGVIPSFPLPKIVRGDTVEAIVQVPGF